MPFLSSLCPFWLSSYYPNLLALLMWILTIRKLIGHLRTPRPGSSNCVRHFSTIRTTERKRQPAQEGGSTAVSRLLRSSTAQPRCVPPIKTTPRLSKQKPAARQLSKAESGDTRLRILGTPERRLRKLWHVAEMDARRRKRCIALPKGGIRLG